MLVETDKVTLQVDMEEVSVDMEEVSADLPKLFQVCRLDRAVAFQREFPVYHQARLKLLRLCLLAPQIL